ASADVNNVVVACKPSADPGPGTPPGPGPGGTAGSAAECFNPVLLQAGTTYQWDMQGTVNGIVVTMKDKASVVSSNSSFNGVAGLIETQQSLSVTGNGIPGVV